MGCCVNRWFLGSHEGGNGGDTTSEEGKDTELLGLVGLWWGGGVN